MVYIYNEIIIKKEWIIAICSSMDGPGEYHTKWSQTKIDIIWHHLNVESKRMIQMNHI